MAHVQESLQIEIQYLKDALVLSHKKADQYARLVRTLFNEIDELRNNICHDCKKKLVPASTAPSTSLNTSAAPTFCTFRRGTFQERLSPIDIADHGATPNSAISSSVPNTSLSTFETISVDTPANSGPEQTPNSTEPESKRPEFSVVYNPEVKRALDLHLAHVFIHESPVFSMKISPNGQRIAVGISGSGKTIIDEVKTRSNVCVFVDRYVKDSLSIRSLKFSPDGRFLATGANDGRVRIWNITQKRIRAIFNPREGVVYSVAFSPDGRFLISGSQDRSVHIWNIRDGSSKKLPVAKDAGFFVSVVFSPDGRYIAAGDLRHRLRIWDSRTLRLVGNWNGHNAPVWCVEFTPDGKGLMSGSTDKDVNYWDVSSLRIHQAPRVVAPRWSFPLIRSFSGHSGRVRSIAFFPGKNEWLISSDDGNVRVWDIRTGLWQLMVQGHTKSVKQVDISRTEKLLATASLDGHVTLWSYARC